MNSHYLNMGPSPADAERRADKSYPDLQQLVSDFHRPSAGDFLSFAVIVLAVSAVVISGLWFLFASMT